jgi:hypothetical protein
VAPNPATDQLTIGGYIPSSETVISIQDLTGKVIESKMASQAELTFDLSALQNGNYLLVAKDAFGTRTQKFVKL